LTQLHTLSLAANTRHAEVGRSMLAALCHPQATTTELRAFDFSNNPTPRAAIASLAQLPHLTHLDLHGCGLDDGAAVQLLTTSPAPLQWLNLAIGHHHDTAPLSDATLLALAQTPHADRLQALNLSGSSLSAQGFELLASAFPQLRVVVLRQVLLSNDGAAALASAPHLQQLQRLDLEGSRISPHGLTLLQRSSQLPALRHLNLAANPEVADVDGHEALLQSSLGQRLETLGFPNAYLRAAVRRRLGDAFPRELSVEWGRPDQYSLMTRRRFEGETVYDPLWVTA
ncbi:MAG: hypothetical protein AAFX99_36685, partial [Myxococcota bacterium]